MRLSEKEYPQMSFVIDTWQGDLRQITGIGINLYLKPFVENPHLIYIPSHFKVCPKTLEEADRHLDDLLQKVAAHIAHRARIVPGVAIEVEGDSTVVTLLCGGRSPVATAPIAGAGA